MELREQGPEVWQIETAVQRVHGRGRAERRSGEGDVVDVGVYDVERLCPLNDLAELLDMRREVVLHGRIGSQRLTRRRDEVVSRRRRVSTRKQRHLVTVTNQFIDEVADDALGAARALRRHRLGQGRDLSDPHLKARQLASWSWLWRLNGTQMASCESQLAPSELSRRKTYA